MKSDMIQNSSTEPIDLQKILKVLLSEWKLIAKVCAVVLVLSSIYVLSIPRQYSASTTLAPEFSNSSGISGNISSLASMVGVNIGNSGEDAIYPEIYPDIVGSTDFLVGLFDIKVKSSDGSIDCTLYEYLKYKQEQPWWSFIGKGVKAVVALVAPPKKDLKAGADSVDPFWLSKDQEEICKNLGGSISCMVDKKTSVITIGFSAQDPLIAATMTDSLKQKLQDFIIEYRTSKARNDLRYVEKLCAESKLAYDKVRARYAEYCDSHKGTILQAYISEQENLENELQLAMTSYSQMAQQVQMAKAKVQERTPAFTVVDSTTVPLKPSKPKRMLIVIGCVFMALVCSSSYVYIKRERMNVQKVK